MLPTVRMTSHREIPPLERQTFLLGILIAVVLVAAVEAALAMRGIRPTGKDDEGSWMNERARASRLGKRGLMLIGASRIQTDVDLVVLRARTGLEPVQLAIDASSFIPVLSGLAADATINGTVLVSFSDNALASTSATNIADRYEAAYARWHEQLNDIDFESTEYALDTWVRSHLRSFADGARPLTALLTRVVTSQPNPQHAVFLPDRSRLADYSGMDIDATYYSRVLRQLGKDIVIEPGTPYSAVDVSVRAEIAQLPVIDDEAYRRGIESVNAATKKIEARGGHVIFVVFPTSGLISEMEEHTCPRVQCWDKFVTTTAAQTFNFLDVPYLKNFPVPDGSHIDYRNRPQLTLALIDLLHLDDIAGNSKAPQRN